MCGIVGYIGSREASPIILNGLKQLEYRGYDSAGMAVLGQDGNIHVRRQEGKLVNLETLVDSDPVCGFMAIGHTRWATHGPPHQRNAHPHLSPDGELAVVQNGIVENFAELREKLRSEGYFFASETDTEVIVHLIHSYYRNGCQGNLVKSVQKAVGQLRGPSAIVVMDRRNPDQLVAARLGNAGGVAVGLGNDEMFIASDIPAILNHTRRVTFLDSREMAVLTDDGVMYMDIEGNSLDKEILQIAWDTAATDKGEYTHYMQKEIYEQGRSLTATLRDRIDFDTNCIKLDSLNLPQKKLQSIEKVTIVACGTSYYAGLIGKFYIEKMARIPVEVDYASEYRYRSPIINEHHIVLAITQSGETVDTLAALEEAKENDAFTAAIVNSIGSQAARICDGIIYMQAGPEIGVASTKAFTASVADLFMLALYLAQERETINADARTNYIKELLRLPGLAGEILEDAWKYSVYSELAEKLHVFHNFLYLGRGINYPVALEGALKLKEISYIHAEGYPAGEMKHGPIALIDEKMPTVIVAPNDSVYNKMLSQLEQVKARNGIVLAIAHANDPYIREMADYILPIPKADELLTPILATIPMQLLAYEIASLRGEDVDQPRNLAKSVTVE